MNAFGEQLDIEQAERALAEACRRAHADIVDFSVAPYYASSSEPRGRHEWLVEFVRPPRCPVEIFVHALDETLQQLNPAYRIRRAGDQGMLGPRVVELPAGTFHRWSLGHGGRDAQRTVPRIVNDRTIADSLLEAAGVPPREPLVLT